MTKKILVEGWRGINHSYAMVNQYQLLTLKKLNFELFHNDAPFYRPNWNPNQSFSGFNQCLINEIESVSSLKEDITPDITYRISFPYNLTSAKSKSLFVYGTSEYQSVNRDMVIIERGVTNYRDIPLTLIVPSKWSKQGFLNAGFAEEQIRIIPHGVDLSIFRPLDADLRARYRSILGADQDSFVILSLGGMYQNKGIDILLSAYIELKRKYPQLRLVLKDQSNLYGITANSIVNQYCQQKNISITSTHMQDIFSGIVCITDNLNLEQLNGLYCAADCYASPYRAEGFNLPPLEAAACGTPIIVTKGGSTDDYFDQCLGAQIESKIVIKDNMTQLEPSLDSLMGSIEQLITKPLDYGQREKSRDFLNNGWSWTQVTNKLAEIFNNS